MSKDNGPVEEKLRAKSAAVHETGVQKEEGEGDTSPQAQVPFFLTSVSHRCGALRTAESSSICLTPVPQGLDFQSRPGTTQQPPYSEVSRFVD